MRGKPATATYIQLLQEDDDAQAESSAAASAKVNLVADELAAWMEGTSKERVEVLSKVQTVIIAMALGYDHACLLPDGGRGAVHSLSGTFTAELKNGEYSIRYIISRAEGCICPEEVLKEDADNNNDELKGVCQSVRRAVVKRSSHKTTTPNYATTFDLSVAATAKP
ncbi:hypothetical protein KC349_g5165 [Hortaea werneckii]|nr:hypothetical protein KC349_g5165 [Hortaea werneckii]